MLTDVFVPLLTYPDADTEAMIECAMRVCRPFATSVAFTTFEVDIPNIAYSLGAEFYDVSGLIAEAEKFSRANTERLGKRIAQLGGALPVTSATARMRQDEITLAATAMAALHDLSIIEVKPGAIGQRELAEGLVFGSGRPILVLPAASPLSPVHEHIAIAWDGGRAAARAVQDAMPLLVKARSVTLLTAFDDKAIGESTVAGLAGYLRRHAIEAKHHDVSSAGISIGAALQAGASKQGAGLLVMGAFGHSRIRDFVMGGATRSTLDEVKLPIFLSH
ncbi:universal stress protein [Devosia psychrophila]|uniref:Universal stress protein family protein n=1 Tax=Devosia psychrophila TaxID=728005 RepID=A0A1I1S2D5_9HYPH|nr:universal stress protein [Devosia psychrophila]SFD38708.1 hypothetical protein SAMN04488059_14914 [Devosia psychrophila]